MRLALPLTAGLLAAALGGAAFAAPMPPKPPPGPMPAQDFVSAAGQSDAYEIMAGRLVVQQSGDPQVRAFAQQMIDDHGRTSQALAQAALASGLPPPPKAPGGDMARMLSALQSLKGPDLDKAYVTQQVNAHVAALVTEQGYAATGDDPNLRQAAQSAAPLIQHHLEMARQMKQAMGGG